MASVLFSALTLSGLPQVSAVPSALFPRGEPPPPPPGRCEGKPVGVYSEALEQCLTQEISSQKVFTVAQCNGSELRSVSYVNASGCKGGPGVQQYVQSFDVNKCIHMPGTRGTSTRISCDGTSATFASWSLAPAPPSDVSCDGASAGADSLQVSCRVDAREIDEVSFEVASPSGRPFLTVTGPVGAGGEAKTSIPGLRSNTQYRVTARAHRRGEQEGNPDAWSRLSSQSALCSTAKGGLQQRPQGGRPEGRLRRPKTRWIETYRLVNSYGPADELLPDFLDQHNGADLPGIMGLVTLGGSAPGLPLTRYCVEVLDVQVPDVITASVDGRPQTAPFADYASCNQGACRCMHQVDRSISHLPARQILELCAGHPPADKINNTCRCPESSVSRSSRYVGRSPIPLPFYTLSSLAASSFVLPPSYPPSYRPEPVGSFYSFPVGGRCPLGAGVGDRSCTWQRSPVAHTVHTDDLVQMGLNVSSSTARMQTNKTTGETISIEVDYDATVGNLRIVERAFAALRPPPCGEPAAAAAGETAAIVV
uniref:Fibronectin type-III domain-containing protein n=1 Tax=Alexandrium monilatum TaxID=311494 RepID=A0A7S4QW38_9DINO